MHACVIKWRKGWVLASARGKLCKLCVGFAREMWGAGRGNRTNGTYGTDRTDGAVLDGDYFANFARGREVCLRPSGHSYEGVGDFANFARGRGVGGGHAGRKGAKRKQLALRSYSLVRWMFHGRV